MTQDAAIYLGTIAAIGFILKATILFNVEIKSKVAESFVVLCLIFVIQNVAEFLAYFTYLKSTQLGEFFIHIYYITLWFIFPSVLVLALAMTKYQYLKQARIILYTISSIATIAYMNGLVVAGFTFLGWSVSGVPGQYYWLAMIYILFCCVSTIGYLAYQFVKNTDNEIRYNSKIYLIAFSPIVLVAVSVLLLKILGFNSTSVVSFPIASLIFLYILLLHTNGNLFWITTKCKTVLAVLMMHKDASVDSLINEIEKVRIQEALKLTNGQQKSAAELLGVPASTLNKRLSKHKIKANNFKPGGALRGTQPES
jgi:hypothetical protein